jgi:hypothetical protein
MNVATELDNPIIYIFQKILYNCASSSQTTEDDLISKIKVSVY